MAIDDGKSLPFDVADNRTIFYTFHVRRVDRAKEELASQIKRVLERGYKPRNPILDAIGLITLERSTERAQQAIAALARDMESLRADFADWRSRFVPIGEYNLMRGDALIAALNRSRSDAAGVGDGTGPFQRGFSRPFGSYLDPGSRNDAFVNTVPDKEPPEGENK
jgi:hypothetical protein